MQCHTIKIVQKLDIYNRFKNDKVIFMETILIDLHFAADSMGLSSFKFFW